MKGIESKRMIIENVSENMKIFINSILDVTYANIELRPSGILLRIVKSLKNHTWIIPNYQLVIYKTNSCSIHSQGSFIHFKTILPAKKTNYFLVRC